MKLGEQGMVVAGEPYLPDRALYPQQSRRGGRQRGGGNDPRYNKSCEELWKLYEAAKGKEKAELNTILKLKGCQAACLAAGLLIRADGAALRCRHPPAAVATLPMTEHGQGNGKRG